MDFILFLLETTLKTYRKLQTNSEEFWFFTKNGARTKVLHHFLVSHISLHRLGKNYFR